MAISCKTETIAFTPIQVIQNIYIIFWKESQYSTGIGLSGTMLLSPVMQS